jgi:hypothetical protein
MKDGRRFSQADLMRRRWPERASSTMSRAVRCAQRVFFGASLSDGALNMGDLLSAVYGVSFYAAISARQSQNIVKSRRFQGALLYHHSAGAAWRLRERIS